MASKTDGLIQKISSNNITHSIASTAYGICETAAAEPAKTVEMTGFTLLEGTTIHIKFTYNNTVSSPTLNVNNTGAKPIVQYGTTAVSTSSSTSGWYAGAVVSFTYDGTSWVRDQGFNTNSTYTITSVWCNTAAGTAAKTFSNASYYTANDKSYFEITFRYTNTAQSALTLNNKELYIDGKATSSSNYTLPAGKYLVYYENGIYYIRTDGKITGNITGDAATVNGLTVQTAVPANAVFTDTNKYHKSGSWNGLTYTADAVNEADELKFTIPDSYGDTKNPYGEKAKNLVLAGPSSGSNATPSFRALVAADIPNSILKWQTTTVESTALYDFGVYVNMNNANGSGMNGSNYFNILNVPYRKASGNTKADWGWQLGNITSNDGRLWYRTAGDNVWGDWQTIAHATQSTNDIGSSSQPVYMTKTGVITAVTAVGAAYGGTGKTTLNDSANVLINALGTGSSPLTADDYVITQYVGGGTTTTTYHRRPANLVVNSTLVKAALGTVSTTAKKFLKDTGAWVQVDWADLTGKPTSFSPTTHNHSQIVTVGDNRSIATTPNDYKNALIFQGLKNKGYIGNPSTDTYSYLIGLRGWSDYSGGDAHEFAFNNNGINWRHGATDTWSEWKTIAYTDSTVARATADASGNTITSTYAPLASPALTGTPTAPTAADGTNTTQIATTAFVMSQFKYNDAMIYKGVVNANADLPATHYQGWTYKVATAGTYAGIVCEIGDMIICNTDGTSANNAHWNVIQTNIDGAVIGPASSTDNAIARFDSTTGKIIQNSGVTVDDSNNILTKGNLTLNATSGNSPALIFTRDGGLTDWKIFVASGKLSFQSTTNASTWTERASFADNSGNFTVTGTMTATDFYGGGTNITLGTANAAVVTDSNKKLSTRTITNNTSNTAITNSNTNIPTMNTIYYGLVTVNNASQTRATGIYAPTSAGTADHVLISKGGNNAPVWTVSATLASATSTTANTAAYDILTLGNSANVSTTTAHSEGKIVLYSAATAAHTIVGQSTTTAHTHTLPNTDGVLLDSENYSTYLTGTYGIEIIRLST